MKIIARATPPQTMLVNSKAQYPAMVAGFGAGKSHALILKGVKMILDEGHADVGFYLPDYQLMKTIAYPRFTAIFADLGIPFKLNQSDHIMQVNGRRIIFRTMNNVESIIGYEVGDSLADELDTLPSAKARKVWEAIIARNRQKKPNGEPNTAAVGTTPEGFRFVYEQWERDKTANYELIRAPSYSNPYLPEGYIDSLREIYPDHLLEAYIEGQFVNLTTGSVYPSFSRERNHCPVEFVKNEPLHIGIDFNVNNMACVIHAMRFGKAYAGGEISKGRDTPTVIEMIKDTYPHHPIIVYPDASGAATSSTNASSSDIILLKNAGFEINAPRANGLIKDRVAASNMAFCNNEGQTSYYIDCDKCPDTARSVEQQAYDVNGKPDKKAGLDHHNDARDYFTVRRFPIKRRQIFTGNTRWT